MRGTRLACGAAIAVMLVWSGSLAAGPNDTVNAVKQRGQLLCGVSTGGSTGMSTLDSQGNWQGFEVDFCRAVSAALLGDAAKVKFVPLEFKNAFTALQSGDVDILARTATWTYTRNTELNLDWAGIYMYDGQGFLVSKTLGVKSGAELNGASICVAGGSTSELNLADYFRTRRITYTPIVGNTREQSQANLEAGRCDAYTNERGGLAASRTALKNPDGFVILPDVFSKEPLGPIVRKDDPRFRDIVAWTLNMLIAAEELAITQKAVTELAAASPNPEIQRMLGKTGSFGPKMGLAEDWGVKAILAVGNYGEMYDRNLGEGSPIKLARGPNRLWNDGGLFYAPPFR
ncbi:MAG: amino acid ABC transporter substrate-binding protein [Proteobacteria bacterium]|nr:amino acid ABC transporter substrate-binding protein [Pseudomonadota bacterium]MBI3496380.1 amino acid ABC transporter substrate-binding protein [Pseudomonadota bacterium]